MILNKIHLLTVLDVWFPRYSDQYKQTGEKVALLACYKVDMASPIFIVNFSRAKHLKGQRFAIERRVAQQCPVDSNGKIPCYAVKMSLFENYQTAQEILDITEELWPSQIR